MFGSRISTAAKQALKFKTVSLPRYSPDLNPLDYFLWNDIEKRMARSAPKTAHETLVKFKERLRRTALATSPNLIRKAMLNMKRRIVAIYEAQGGDVKID